MHKHMILIGIILFIGIIGTAAWYFMGDSEKLKASVLTDVQSDSAILLDVRTQEEWDQGHAQGAQHFDLQRLEKGELPELDHSAKVYVYCRSGTRAGIAKSILEKNGFSTVTNIGGLSDWQALGGTVTQ